MTQTGSEPLPSKGVLGPTFRPDATEGAKCFKSHLYRGRNIVEQFFNKNKQCRPVTTRYDSRSELPRLHPARVNTTGAASFMSSRRKPPLGLYLLIGIVSGTPL